MNTDKIYAEQLANEYAPKDTSKVIALRKLSPPVENCEIIAVCNPSSDIRAAAAISKLSGNTPTYSRSCMPAYCFFL